MTGITNTQGIVAIDLKTGEAFTGGAITNSTIDSTTIGATTPSTGSFTTVSAATGVFTGDVVVSGKVTVGQAVSAASFHANAIVSAGTDLNAAGNIIAGARTVVVSGDSGRVNATLGAFSSIVSAAEINSTGNLVAGARSVVVSGDSGNITAGGKVDITGAVSAASGHFTGVVSAASLNVTGDVAAATGKVTTSAATVTALLTGQTATFSGIVSAAEINSGGNLVAGARTVICSGDSGSITATNLTVTSANIGTLNIPGTSISWTPGYTGFSANPASPNAKYQKIGKMVTLYYADTNNGTSNATTYTITSAPFAAAAGTQPIVTTVVTDAGVQGIGTVQISGTTITMTKLAATGGGGFTAAGNKSTAGFVYVYESTT